MTSFSHLSEARGTRIFLCDTHGIAVQLCAWGKGGGERGLASGYSVGWNMGEFWDQRLTFWAR